jgi:hypothetical protein
MPNKCFYDDQTGRTSYTSDGTIGAPQAKPLTFRYTTEELKAHCARRVTGYTERLSELEDADNEIGDASNSQDDDLMAAAHNALDAASKEDEEGALWNARIFFATIGQLLSRTDPSGVHLLTLSELIELELV